MLDYSTEVYKKIKGFENYSVSNFGNIKNNRTGKEISKRIANNGYVRVNLYDKNSKRFTVAVHRLVAEAFVPKEDGKNFVNHKDCDKTNNYYKNLEWCTPSENSKHAFLNIKGLDEKYRANLRKSYENNGWHIDIYKDGKFISHFKSKREVAKYLGVDEKTIYNYLHNKTKCKNGYEFIVKGGGASARTK